MVARVDPPPATAPAAVDTSLNDNITVGWCVEWKGEKLQEGTLAGSCFKFQDFHASAIIAVSEKADDVVLTHAKATLSSQAPAASRPSDLKEQSHYDGLFHVARNWAREKRKNVMLEILYKYDSLAAMTAIESSKKRDRLEVSDADSNSNSDETVEEEVLKKQTKKPRQTTTSRQKKAVADRDTDELAAVKLSSDVVRGNICERVGCPGYDFISW